MEEFGVVPFITRADTLSCLVVVVLLAMSLASWTLILAKFVQLRSATRGRLAFLADYRQLRSPATLAQRLAGRPSADGCAGVAAAGVDSLERWSRRDERRRLELGDVGDFIAAALALAVAREQDRLAGGLAFLAAVGSTAPFIGLLGTVWGIYHALIAIGTSAQGTIDKVAGPVGEALLMTALGLAVAIPAVLAYNAFVRATQRAAAELDGFAHEALAFLATGVHAAATASANSLNSLNSLNSPPAPAAAAMTAAVAGSR